MILRGFAALALARTTSLGAFERATVGWFDIASKSYRKIEVNEQCEVLSAIGDVAVGDDGKPSLHVHIVLGLADGSTRGGHLLAGTVRPTLEVVLTEVPATLRRKKRADLGIALIDLAAGAAEASRAFRNHYVQSNVVRAPTMEDVMAEKDLNELFLDTLKDIYYAEKQILKALPKMAKAANSDKLRAAFEKHHDETEGQVERLEQIFELLGKAARGKKCDAIEGILDEGKEIMEEYADTPALDAGLLAAAQAVEHYEISRYGTLKAWALKLNNPQAAKLLDQTLAEEKKTDETLTKIAETAVNYEAAA